MSVSDRQRWDSRWAELADDIFTPHPLLVQFKDIFTGGIAADLACGIGQNAIWLAGRGYKVLAIDISTVALTNGYSKARAQGVADKLAFTQMDLSSWSLAKDIFDLVCVFRYLERNLFSGIREGLKAGGLLVYSTRHTGILRSQPHANKNYLLHPGELMDEFSQWDIIHYQEGGTDAQIVARKQET